MLIRPALNEADMDAVYRLTHDAYVALGYIQPRPEHMLRHYMEIEGLPENMVVVAVDDGAIVGTVSITLDGPGGLHTDHDFAGACDAIRAEGRPIGAAWRIITEPGHRATMALVVELIRAAITVFQHCGTATGLCTFAPRHERVYMRLLGFQTIARTDGVGAVNTAAVLMRGSVAEAMQRMVPPENPALATLATERMRLIAALRRAAA